MGLGGFDLGLHHGESKPLGLAGAMYCVALMVSETHNAQMLRVSGHSSAVLDFA